MSLESYNAFKARLASDATLGSELSRTVGTQGTIDDLVAFARSHGYEFDHREIKQGLELNDDELEHVAGGTSNTKASPVLMLACATGTHIKTATITV